MTAAQTSQRTAHSIDGPLPHPRAFRVWLLAALGATAVYLPTMAPGVLWGDSGDAQLRVLTGAWCDSREVARSHVTYYAAAIALHRVLRLEAALAANLIAALAGVITVANIAWLLALVVRDRVALICGTALLLFSHTFWQLSTGAEVITFSAMFLSFELVMAVQFLNTGRSRWLALAALANGLGWSTHNFAMLMWPAYLLTFVLRRRAMPRLGARSLGMAAGLWLAGCLPLLVLIVLEYQRLGQLGPTVRSLLVGTYSGSVLNVRVDLGLLLRVIAYGILCFPSPIVLLAASGWSRFRRNAPPGAWLLLTVAAATYTTFAARYVVPDQYTFMVPSYLFLVFFVAVGVERWVGRHRSAKIKIALVALSLIGPLAYAVAPPLVRQHAAAAVPFPKRVIPYREPYNWFLRPWRNGYHGPERYAREVLASLPPGAVLLADSTIRRPLDYVQGREGYRLDVRLPNAVFRRPWQEQMSLGAENAGEFIDTGLLFCTSTVPSYVPGWLVDGRYRFEPHGHVYKVVRTASSTD